MDLWFIGDWIVQSAAWWRGAFLRGTQAYERWLMAPPMERLAVEPEVPCEFEQGPWARIERRVALALMKALPESIRSVATRSMGSIAILFAAVFRIFPGGWEREQRCCDTWQNSRCRIGWENGSQPFETGGGGWCV
jgi:hypothetical protein